MPSFLSRERILRGAFPPTVAGIIFLACALLTFWFLTASNLRLATAIGGGITFGAVGVATAVDIRRLILPDPWLALGALAAFGHLLWLVGKAVTTGDTMVVASAGVVFMMGVVGGSFAFILFFFIHYFSKGQVGLGDAKLAGVLGIWLGPFGWAVMGLSLLVAVLLGGLGALVVALRRGVGARFAYGPYLTLGAVVGTVWAAGSFT